MKGVVFTEFLEMVEEKYSLTVVDEILDKAALESKGVFTAVGTYPPQEMVRLVGALSDKTGLGAPTLLREFGKFLLGRFVRGYPQFFAGAAGTFAFLEQVEGHIHVEVRKLYPDAELPRFTTDSSTPGKLVLTYSSPRCLADLAEGLMLGCAEHYGERVDIAREDLSGGKGEVVRFTLTGGARAWASGASRRLEGANK